MIEAFAASAVGLVLIGVIYAIVIAVDVNFSSKRDK